MTSSTLPAATPDPAPDAALLTVPGIPFPVPAGMRLSPQHIRHNAERVFAHQALGTRMVGLRRDGVMLQLDWDPRHVGDPDTGAVMNGVVATLLDHATGLTMVAALDGQGQPGGTLELRVDYLGTPVAHEPLLIEGRCQRLTDTVVFLAGRAWQPGRPHEPIATGAATYVVDRTRDAPASPDAPATPIDLPDIHRHDGPALALAEPFAALVARTRGTRDIDTLARSVPYLAFLGLRVREQGGALVAELPAWEQHIGNYISRHLHGGVIAAALEAMGQLQLLQDGMAGGLPTAVSFTTEFLRGAELGPLWVRAHVIRRGRRFASVRCEAWQQDAGRPVAIGHGTFRATA